MPVMVSGGQTIRGVAFRPDEETAQPGDPELQVVSLGDRKFILCI